MIRVLIADDHEVVRRGLKSLLESESDIVVAGEASNGNEFFAALQKNHFDLAILDISMPGESGLDLLTQVKKRHPKVPIIILTFHPESRFGYRALRAGAKGYITKDKAPAELIQGIRKVAAGGTYISEPLAGMLVFGLRAKNGGPVHETLSDREYQIMRMIASGKTIKEIAGGLSLSAGTVYTHRERILGKMKMKTNVDIAHYAVVNGLVD